MIFKPITRDVLDCNGFREYRDNFITRSREVEFSVMKTVNDYVNDGIGLLSNSSGSVIKDIHIQESARRIAHKLQGQKYPLLSQHKFDDLLLSVIQNPRTRCVDENDLCAYLMRYIGFSDAEEDIVTILRSRLKYLTGEIAGQVKVELVVRDL